MPTSTLKIIIAIFLVAHAFIHISLSWAPITSTRRTANAIFPVLEKVGCRSEVADQQTGTSRECRSDCWMAAPVSGYGWLCVGSARIVRCPGIEYTLDSTGCWRINHLHCAHRSILASLASNWNPVGCSDVGSHLFPLSGQVI